MDKTACRYQAAFLTEREAKEPHAVTWHVLTALPSKTPEKHPVSPALRENRCFSNRNYALFEEPNSRILPITVSLIASRAGPRYLRGSYSSGFAASVSRTAFAEAIWFSVLTLIFAVPKRNRFLNVGSRNASTAVKY